jgi:hypothetical protein
VTEAAVQNLDISQPSPSKHPPGTSSGEAVPVIVDNDA